MANPTYKPNEGKREEFRRFLEKTGVMDALTKALVLLYEEPDRPDDALKFIQNSLAKQTGNDSIDEMKSQIAQLQEKIAQLETDNQNLTESLATSAAGGNTSGILDGGKPSEKVLGNETPKSSQKMSSVLPSRPASAMVTDANEPAATPAPAVEEAKSN